MIALGVIKEAFEMVRKENALWFFTIITVTVFGVIVQFVISADKLFDVRNSPLNFWVLFLVLLFMTIIETGLIEGVNNLRLGKRFQFSGVIQALKLSGKHLPFIYIFLLIILSVFSVFFAPIIVPVRLENGLVVTSIGSAMSINIGLFLTTLFLFLAPMTTRYFVLRSGTYWQSTVEGVKILIIRFVDTVILLLFVALTALAQLSLPLTIAFLRFSWIDATDVLLGDLLSLSVSIIASPFGMIVGVPIFSFFLSWWSATLTLYFQEIQEATAEKPKWIRR